MTTQVATPISKGQKVAIELSSLVKARNPLIWIVSKEEARVEGFIAEAAAAAGYATRVWDAAQGVTGIDGKSQKIGSLDAGETLAAIRAIAENDKKVDRCVWIMRDLPIWLTGLSGASVLRSLRNLTRLLPGVPRDQSQAIFVLSPDGNVPAELSGHATVIDFPLPDRSEIAQVLDAALGALPEDKRKAATPTNGQRDAAIDAAVGLSGEEAAACYARSLVQAKKIDPALVLNEKRRVISRDRVLEWVEPIEGGLDAVGGLDNLKTWLHGRKSAWSQKARDYGLPAPKGAFFAGVSGCGKTLLAKATATAWGVPLIKLDLGALKSKFVGESEGNIRKAFRVIEAIGRCVVWCDEVEKQLQGSTSGSADGGVSSDALGALLTWMQERQGEAFVICTANDISGLPPEFLRKGRFDEIWFVDVPTVDERKAVLKAALAANKRASVLINYPEVAAACENFTGAEIAALVPEALFVAFDDGAREITTEDLIAVAGNVVPLTTTASEKIGELRKWAKARARSATAKALDTRVASTGRQIEI